MKNTTIKSLILSLLICLTFNLLASNVPEYKQKTVQRIFNDLKAAKGIFPHEAPQLVMDPVFVGSGNLVFAYIDYAQSEIHLEELIYDVCVAELGVDSLNGIAFMLGHELAHFLNRHESVAHHTPKEYQDLMGDKVLLDILQGRIKGLDSTMVDVISKSLFQFQAREGEAKADLEGGFITYLAGYGSKRNDPTLPSIFLEKIYAEIGAGSQMRGYPKLEERQAIASSSKIVLDSLIHLYEMANALASIEHYEEAMTYYEILTRTFESREIYNNMGVNAFLDATKCFDASILPKNMPITLDVDSRLDGGSKGRRPEYDDNIRLKKLNAAIKYFEKAAQMDSEYPIAHLNLSVARLLTSIAYKEPFDSRFKDSIAYQNQILLAKASALQAEMSAKSLIEKLNIFPEEKLKVQSILSNVYVQMASIAEEENKQKDQALFSKMAKQLVPDNIFLADNGVESNVGNRMDNKCEKMETAMSGNNLLKIYSLTKSEWTAPIRVRKVSEGMSIEEQMFQRFENDEISLYFHEARFNTADTTYIMLVYPKGDVESVCGMKIGSSFEELKTSYGKPLKFFAVTGGAYVVYDRANKNSASNMKDGVVFFVDNKLKIKSWFSYLKSGSE